MSSNAAPEIRKPSTPSGEVPIYGNKFYEPKLSEARSKIKIVQSKIEADAPPPSLKRVMSQVLTRSTSQAKEKCLVCDSPKPNIDFTQLSPCNHKYCNECILAYLSYRILVNEIPVTCLNEGCNTQFNEQVAIFDKLPDTLKIKYRKFVNDAQVLRDPNRRHCPTTDCEGILDLKTQPFMCGVCKKQYCRVCFLPAHIGNCDNNADQFLQQNYNFKKCPSCHMLIEKSEGCIHMTCKCSHQFCYSCGANWHDKHMCFENAYLTTPVSNCQRAINYAVLPFWAVFGFLLWLVCVIIVTVLVVAFSPFFLGFELFKGCGFVLGLVMTVAFYPFLLIFMVIALVGTFNPSFFQFHWYVASVRYLAR